MNDQPRQHAKRRIPTWAALAICCAAQFMVVLDVSIVNVALPQMRRSLGLSVTGQQWVINAYTLTFAGFLMLGGRAADLFGRRRVFMLGPGRLHRLQPARRTGPERRLAHRGPRRPGPRRRHPRSRHAQPPDHHLRRAVSPPTSPGGLVVHRRQRRRRRRPRRWGPHRPVELALGSVRQCSHRRRAAGRRGRGLGRVESRHRAPQSRPARRGDRDRRAGRARLRHRQHRHPRVGLGHHHRDLGHRSRRCC